MAAPSTTTPRVVTFGEVMLRLAPPGFLRLTQARSLALTFGGAEVNVAVSLAQLGLDATFVTRLPKNDVAQACINEVRGLGVDTTRILRGGERMGVYFVEKGAAQRASTVLYDRAHSAIAEIEPASAVIGTRSSTARRGFTGPASPLPFPIARRRRCWKARKRRRKWA